jgi:hypothetical protein
MSLDSVLAAYAIQNNRISSVTVMEPVELSKSGVARSSMISISSVKTDPPVRIAQVAKYRLMAVTASWVAATIWN